MRDRPSARSTTRFVSSSKWRRWMVLLALLPFALMMYLSFELSVAVSERLDHNELAVPRLAERTAATVSEYASTMLTQWAYLRYLNPQLLGLMTPHLPPSMRTLLGMDPPESASSARQEIPGTFASAAWLEWLESVGNLVRSLGYQGPTPVLSQLCHANILLRFAPWCGYDSTAISEWLMDHDSGVGVSVDRRSLQQEALHILKDVSTVQRLTAHDAAMVEGVQWQPWRDRLAPSDVAGDQPGGTILFRRTRVRYPVLAAMRKPPTVLDETNPYDAQGRLQGFHACMFGSRRNISSTFERLERNLLDTTRPQYFHVATSADGIEEYAGSGGSEAHKRALLFNSFLDIVGKRASTFVAMERDLATSRHGCVICRGFFLREVCRATLLSELHRGVPVEMVMMFRPDMHMWNPVYLTPYLDGVEVLPDSNRRVVVKPQPSGNGSAPIIPAVAQWRLLTAPLWSLIVDKGFLPTTFGVYNDVNISTSSVVVHCRVTFPLDLHWIGDPIVLGHWKTMNHWMECFSVVTASRRLAWIDDNAGETHHAAFYKRYMRPLFELGSEASVLVDRLDLRVYDFQFSLYRSDPIVNAQLLSLGPNYVAYQQQTIFNKFATKWDHGECMRYYFIPRQFNVSSFYMHPRLYFFGEIGRVKMVRIPLRVCAQVRTPPGIQTCFAQYQRIVFYKKGKNIHNPCKPYCGVFPLLMRDGVCAHVGNKGPRQRYIATVSTTPMFRNESGEVLRFNLINPQYVRGDTLWFEKQRAREDARREREERETEQRRLQLAATAAPTTTTSLRRIHTVASHRDVDMPDDAPLVEGEESYVRPNVGADGDPIRETKKPRKYHFVRGKTGDKGARRATPAP